MYKHYLFFNYYHVYFVFQRWVPLVLLLIFVIFLPLGWGSVTYILVIANYIMWPNKSKNNVTKNNFLKISGLRNCPDICTYR